MADTQTPKQIDDLALALLLSRLDKQDHVQATTLREVKKTNGSVIELKARIRVLEDADIDARVTALEQTNVLAGDRVAQRLARSANRERRVSIAMQIGSLITGAGLLEAGHALHLW